MRAYRIGRKQAGPWFNRTPPIRGGIFRKQATSFVGVGDMEGTSDTEDETVPSTPDDNVSLVSSECSCGDLGESIHSEGESCLRKRTAFRLDADASSDVQDKDDCLREDAFNWVQPALTRAQFTEQSVQRQAHLDAQSYPCLDPGVQEDIARKYEALHQRIKDDGLYQCQYSEYGKELARYLTLFAAFIWTLRSGWYITSAVFLGLFWVCHHLAILFLYPCLPVTASDNVHGA